MWIEWLRHILFVTMLWLHIVCTTLVVGGTLFFEFVVPLAVEDLMTEQQLTVFGKARWVFRRVIWPSAFLLILSGAAEVYRLWDIYTRQSYQAAMWMVVAHAGLGILAIGIALGLTVPASPPDRPVAMMRVNLAVLLLAILAATAARHTRLVIFNRENSPAARHDPDTVRGAIVGPSGARGP